MKKVVLFFAVCASVALSSCGNSQPAEAPAQDTTAVADTTAPAADTTAKADSTAPAAADSAAAPADSAAANK